MSSPKKKALGHEGQKSALLMMSPAARQIVQEAMRGDVSIAELSALASADPSFAVRVLALANSAAYGGSRQVASVNVAASMLGVRGMRNAALGMLVAEMLPAAEGTTALLENCLRRALVARELAKESGLVSKDEAFFAGLLLEIGLLHQACDDFENAVEASRAPGRSRVARERSLGLVPHTVRGAQIARELSLPESLALAIAEHHDERAPSEPMSKICWAAEWVASVLEPGHEQRSLRLAESACAQASLKVVDMMALLQKVDAESRDLAVGLGESHSKTESRLRRAHEEDLAELVRQYEDTLRLVERLLDERVPRSS